MDRRPPTDRAIDDHAGGVGRRSPGRSGSTRSSCPSVRARSHRRTVGREVVGRGAEEHELAVGQPRAAADRCRRQREHPVAHRGEVGDDPVHVLDRRPQIGRRAASARSRVEAVDLDLRPRLERSSSVTATSSATSIDVVDRRRGGRPASGARAGGWSTPCRSSTIRIVSTRNGTSSVTSSTHRAVGVPAVAVAVGRQHADERLARLPHPAEVEVGDGDGVEVVIAGGRRRRTRAARSSRSGRKPRQQRIVGAALGGEPAQPFDGREAGPPQP